MTSQKMITSDDLAALVGQQVQVSVSSKFSALGRYLFGNCGGSLSQTGKDQWTITGNAPVSFSTDLVENIRQGEQLTIILR